MRKSLLALLSAAILTGLLALPAAALDQGVAAIVGGTAEVGDSFTDGAACTKDSQPAPTGRGIGLPRPTPHPSLPPKVDDLDNKYRLLLPNPDLPETVPETMVGLVIPQSGLPALAVGTLRICGNVGPVGGQGMVPKLGPWCGMSKGYNGNGKITFTELPPGARVFWAQLSDVAWKFSAGGFLPILGKVRAQNTESGGAKGPKKDKWGTLVALVNARALLDTPGGQGCNNLDTSGTVFRVDGVAAIIGPRVGPEDGPTDFKNKEDVVTWKDNGDGDDDRQDSPVFCKGSRDIDDGDDDKDEKCPIYQAKTKGTKPKDDVPKEH